MDDIALVNKLQTKLNALQVDMGECVTECGMVINAKKYMYTKLVTRAKRLSEAILELNDLIASGGVT